MNVRDELEPDTSVEDHMPKHATTSTGAMRASIGTKIDTDLVPFELIVAAAVGLGLGEFKYDARNFEKGLSYRSLINSIERHCKSLKDGEELDSDTGIPHFMLIASSTAMLVHNVMQGVVIDDRATPKTPTYSVAELAEIGQMRLDEAIAFFNEKNTTDIGQAGIDAFVKEMSRD